MKTNASERRHGILLTLASLSITCFPLAAAEAGTGGRIVGAWTAGGAQSDRVYDVAADATGGFVIVGEFFASITFGTTTLTSAGESDAFVARYDAYGHLLWAHRGGGLFSDRATRVSVDATGIDVMGWAFGEIEFGGQTKSILYEHAIHLRYDLAGNVISLIDDDSLDLFDPPRRRAEHDERGAGVEVGSFTFALPLDSTGPNGTVLRSDGLQDAYVAEYRLDATMHPELLWAISGGGDGHDGAAAVAFVPHDAAVLVAGNYESVATFTGTNGIDVTLPAAAGETDLFVLRISLQDSDDDGLSDVRETTVAPLTNPLVRDTDQDGVWDGIEVALGTDPTATASVPVDLDGALIAAAFPNTPNPLTLDVNGSGLTPNGIYDSDEFALLMQIIADPALAISDDVRIAFDANLARLYVDAAGAVLPAANHRKAVYAAYLTLGDVASRNLAKVALSAYEGVSIQLANYTPAEASHLSAAGNADCDALSNLAEYVPSNRTAYILAALYGGPGCP